MNRSLILAAYASLFALGLVDNVRGPLFPEILAAFQLPDRIGSWMFALSSAGGLLGAVTCRYWLARFSRIEALNRALLLMGVASLGLAASPTFAGVAAASALLGYGMGLLGVLQNVLVAHGSSNEARSRVLGGLHAMYGGASFLAPLIVAAVAAIGFGWRWSFGAVGLAIFFLLAWSHRRFRRLEHAGHSHAGLLPGAPAPAPMGPSLWMATAVGGYVLAEVMLSSRLALFLRRDSGADLESSSLFLTAFFVALMVGRLATAAVPFKSDPRGLLAVLLVVSAGLMGLGLNGEPWFLVASGFTMGPVYPLLVTFLSREFGDRLDAVMGHVIAIQSLCLVSMHLGVGWLTDLIGIRGALVMGPASLVVSFLLIGCYGAVFHRRPARA